MTIIRYVPQDPFDLVIQGEEMRAQAMSVDVCAPALLSLFSLVENNYSDSVASNVPELIAGEINYSTIVGSYPISDVEILRPLYGNNALIATPCGSLYSVPLGNHIMNNFVQSTIQWLISGVTRDGNGNALGNCVVTILETGRIATNSNPVITSVVSGGSGNYSVSVPMNTSYQIIAYLSDSPDKAGITINTITPIQNG
jgi:hypothetical protein